MADRLLLIPAVGNDADFERQADLPRDPGLWRAICSTRMSSLGAWVEGVIEDFSDRILPVTAAVAHRWAGLSVPDPVPVGDGLIAATAAVHGLVVVTRNVDPTRGGPPAR